MRTLRTRLFVPALFVLLALVAAGCSGTDSVADVDATASESASLATDAASDDALDLGSDDPADPEPSDPTTTDTDDSGADDSGSGDVASVASCDLLLGFNELIGNAFFAEPDSEQYVDAIELMGQTLIALEGTVDPAVLAVATDVHDEFARTVGSGGAEVPDQALLDEASDTFRPYLEDCGAGPVASGEGGEGTITGFADESACLSLDAFRQGATDFVTAESGSELEAAGLELMEIAVLDLGTSLGEAYPDAHAAAVDIFENAQAYVETGEGFDPALYDPEGAAAPIEFLYQDCVTDGWLG